MAFVILLLYAALVFVTIKFKQVYTPAGVMVFLWTALNATLLIFFRDMVELKYSGLLFTSIGVAFFFGGTMIGLKTTHSYSEVRMLYFNRKMITPILTVITIIGFIWPIYYIYTHNFSLLNLFNLDELSEMNKEFSTERYTAEETIGYSKASQLLLIFTYTAPIIGGFCWLISNKIHSKILSILSVLPCIMITASQSTKMAMIIALLFWLSGFLVCALSYNIKLKISIKSIIIGVSILSLFFAIIFYSMLTRWGNNYDDNKIERNKITFFNYAYGSLLCFDYWFNEQIQNTDYSTVILQNAKLHRLGYLTNVENGVRVDFPEYIKAPSMEIYGNHLDECEFFAGNNYTVSFDITSNVQPDSVKYSIVSYTTLPKGHLPLMIDSCKQTGLHTWHYQLSFNLDSNRLNVRTPDIILSYDSVKYVEIKKFRIDTGTVAQLWTNGGSNIFWHKDGLKYGVMTFMGIANAIGLSERKIGLYRDFVYFGRLDKTMRSNVYSLFRLLIEDFGIIGALVFMLVLGFASAKAVLFIKQRKWIFISQAFLVAIYCLIMWSFATSIWAYTSIICAYGLAFFIFSILQKPLHGDTWVTKITKMLKPKQK